MSTDHYILKTESNGLMLLTINDLELKKFAFQHFLGFNDESNWTDSVQVFITPSQIIIAAAQTEWVGIAYTTSSI